MEKPYIICHMMTSVDGRIDCAMTEHLPGTEDYYDVLESLDAPTRVSGRVTAELEMARPGSFVCRDATPVGRTAYHKAKDAAGYEVVTDTRGTLLWDGCEDDKPLLILCSERAPREYLDYLEGLGISWIACGERELDLAGACDILSRQFGVRRMAVVGGGHINAGFLRAGLLDEISLLIGAGIDGREGMAAVFDGLPKDRPVTQLKLERVEALASGAVHILYKV